MFDNLTSRFSCILRNISGRGRITEDNIKETLREVRGALLEADVALSVIHDFINCVKEKALNCKINKSLTPGQEFIKIVHRELITIMGQENQVLNLSSLPPAIILVAGLQGSGKTTGVGKLGKFLREKHKKKVLVVSTDVYRSAAIKQLELLARKANVNFFSSDANQSPVDIAESALKEAKLKFYDVLLIDTAGYLHINDMMIREIKKINTLTKPVETLLFVDAVIGQDAVNIAKTFNEALTLTGIVLTKADSDTRGGAALSVRYVTGKPIKFLGVGEEVEDLEPFYPECIASRILGMGDILSLIENIERKVDSAKTENLITKFQKDKNFDLTDFLEQLRQIKNFGGIMNFMKKLPGTGKFFNGMHLQINDKFILKMEAIINSMTPEERANPDIIKGSRKRRIAAGCGLQVQDVNQLIRRFFDTKYLLRKMKNRGITKMICKH